jgi:hypothetical protein
VQQTEDLTVYFDEMVCDFIQDEEDNWWFIQVTGDTVC